jgi:hypothetical protein
MSAPRRASRQSLTIRSPPSPTRQPLPPPPAFSVPRFPAYQIGRRAAPSSLASLFSFDPLLRPPPLAFPPGIAVAHVHFLLPLSRLRSAKHCVFSVSGASFARHHQPHPPLLVLSLVGPHTHLRAQSASALPADCVIRSRRAASSMKGACSLSPRPAERAGLKRHGLARDGKG